MVVSMSANLWTWPDPEPVTPGNDSAEGWPTPTGETVVPVYHNATGDRRTSELRGVDYYVGGSLVSEDVLAGRINDIRAWHYGCWNLLRWLNILGEGVILSGTGDGATQPVLVSEWVASGTGTSIDIGWRSSQGYGPGQMIQLGNGGWRMAGPDGLFAADAYPCDAGLAHVNDITYNGTIGSQGEQSATLTLHRPINAERSGKVWLYWEAWRWPFPVYSMLLDHDARGFPPRCRHAVETFHGALSSFVAAYPASSLAAGVDGSTFCAKVNETGVDLSQFSATCSNLACPYYEAHEPGYPTDADVTRFWHDGGKRYRQLTLGGGIVIGRLRLAGLLTLLGLPPLPRTVGYTWPQWAGWLGDGAYKISAGVDATGFEQFHGWSQAQAALAEETDNVTQLTALVRSDKDDPAGGLGLGSETLVADADRTPGWIYESATSRRVQGVASDDDMTPTGDGDQRPQRVKARKITSAEIPFAAPAGNYASTDSVCVVTVLDNAEEYKASSFDYDVRWELPSFGHTRLATASRGDKATPTTCAIVAAEIEASGLLAVEFDLDDVTLTRANPTAPPVPIADTFRCGGNVVRSDIAHDFSNPGDARGSGGRQSYLFPGDAMTVGSLGQWTCVGAKAFGGAASGDPGSGPNAATTGVPQFVRDNYMLRDKAWFERDTDEDIDPEDLVGQTFVVSQEAVCPPLVNYLGDATGYRPAVYLTPEGGAPVLLPTDDWRFDPTLGRVYLDRERWPVAGSYRLHFDGWLFDGRTTYPSTVPQAMASALEGVCSVGFVNISDGAVSRGLYAGLTHSSDGHQFVHTGGSFGIAIDVDDFDKPPENDVMINGIPAGIGDWKWRIYYGLGSGGGWVGATLDEGDIPIPTFTWYVPAVVIPYPSLWHADWIAEAKFDISLTGATLYEARQTYDLVNGMDLTESFTYDAIALRLTAVWASGGTFTEARIVEIGDVETSSLSLIEGELRGTVDVTNLLKAIAASTPPNANAELVLLVMPSSVAGPPTNADVMDDVYEYLSEWIGTDRSVPPAKPTLEYAASTSRLSWSAGSFTNLRIRPDFDAMKASAPPTHFDADATALLPPPTDLP